MSDARVLADPVKPHGVVGPNAVIQLARALQDGPGPAVADRVFDEAEHLHLLTLMPSEMIDEGVPARLFASLWRVLPDKTAREIAEEAGRRTARYIITYRIPRLARVLLRTLPPRVARRLLISAIDRNAWTFAGSGVCRTKPGDPAVIEIVGNPLMMPDCVWHRAVFAELFDNLVSGGVQIRHPQCCRTGSEVCRFELAFAP